MRLMTFNVQNMRLRDQGGTGRLDGAIDGDAAKGADPMLDRIDRRLTAEVLHAVQADFVALQEVFDRQTLDFFHDRHLMATGCPPYPHRTCLPGNDGRGLNVAALSRIPPIAIRSHAKLMPADCPDLQFPPEIGTVPIFRRDCLEVELPGLHLYICHFKAPYPDAERSRAIRAAEARTVRWIIEQRFARPAEARWIILGDLNDPATSLDTGPSALDALTDGFAIDLTLRLSREEGWSFRTPDSRILSRPDRILVSPALGRTLGDLKPRVFRAGMDPTAAQRQGGTFRDVGDPRPHASDHAAIYVDLPGL